MNLFLTFCILEVLWCGWCTLQAHGGGFAVLRLLGGFTLLYSGTAIFLGQTTEARIFGFISLFPGLWLFRSAGCLK